MNHRSLLLHSCWSTVEFKPVFEFICLNSFENLQNVSFSSPRFPCFQPSYSLQPSTVSPRPSSPYSAAQPSLLTRLRSPPSAQPARAASSFCVSLTSGARWSSPTSGRTPSRIRAARAAPRAGRAPTHSFPWACTPGPPLAYLDPAAPCASPFPRKP
jgi:hypothetical protein